VLFFVLFATLFVVRVPETVWATFVVKPVRGSDPVRTLHEGTVDKVNVADAQQVDNGAVLFVIASEPVGDRVAERETLDARLSGGRSRLGNEQQKFDNQVRADAQERDRLEQRAANIQRQVTLKEQELATAQDIASRARRSSDEGVGTAMEASQKKLDADRVAVEVEQLRAEATDTRNAMGRLGFEMASRRAGFAELQRGIGEDLSTYRARRGMLDRDRSRVGNSIQVAAPCAGTIVKLHVRSPGAVVHEGDVLADVVCSGDRLRRTDPARARDWRSCARGMASSSSTMRFPTSATASSTRRCGGSARPRPSRRAVPCFVRWPTSGSDTVGVQGLRRPVLPGMTGRAAVIVGRRSLASYAIEPLRQIRESMSGGA
jgi:multidrug resistance efflux pump